MSLITPPTAAKTAAPTATAAPAPAAPSVIPPSIGRVLWYWPSAAYRAEPGAQPCSCQVAYVHNDRMVNIGGMNSNGEPFSETSVPLRQPDDNPPLKGSFVEWMPYQIGAAAK